jgi:uncharacterized membrane protein
MYIIKLWALIIILAMAGIIHLIAPETFLIVFPSFVPWKIPIILLTGFLEIILAIGLAWPRYRVMAAHLSALYFFAIWPVHFYMAIWEIPLGNLESPWMLWARVLLQIPLIYWAASCAKEPSALK